MDTEKCRVLLTVLHERSLSAAAEALGYTPSGVSRLVDSLERETGFPLLHRGRGGVSATRACQELLPLMRRMAELDEQYQQLAHRIQGLDVGRVVAGTNYAAFYPWLSEVIAGFHHAYPGIRVELREGSSTQLGELVDHRRADFCLISQRPGRHKWVPLKDDQLMAILPPTHPLVEADRFPVERLRQEPFIEFLPGQETDNSRMLQQLQIRPKVRFATSDSRAAIAMVRAGLGVSGTIPRSGGNVNGRSSRFMRNVRPAVLRKINVCRRPAAKEPENSLLSGNYQAFHRKCTQKWLVCITD